MPKYQSNERQGIIDQECVFWQKVSKLKGDRLMSSKEPSYLQGHRNSFQREEITGKKGELQTCGLENEQ